MVGWVSAQKRLGEGSWLWTALQLTSITATPASKLISNMDPILNRTKNKEKNRMPITPKDECC
ncbi:hypothetical protein NQZ68_024447 [Dissostichus eleginoides]|nr:hypothetical protein NQZ68_024447 [Dissostichus eleginoides]